MSDGVGMPHESFCPIAQHDASQSVQSHLLPHAKTVAAKVLETASRHASAVETKSEHAGSASVSP